MDSHLLKSFQIITELTIEEVRNNLAVGTINLVALAVEEPLWDLVI